MHLKINRNLWKRYLERKFSWKGDWIVVWKEYCKIWATIWGIPWLILFKLLVILNFSKSICELLILVNIISALYASFDRKKRNLCQYTTLRYPSYTENLSELELERWSWDGFYLLDNEISHRLASVKRKTLVLDLDETLIHSQHDGMGRQTVARPGLYPPGG